MGKVGTKRCQPAPPFCQIAVTSLPLPAHYPRRKDSHSFRRLRDGVVAGCNPSHLCRSPYTFAPTNTSAVARSILSGITSLQRA